LKAALSDQRPDHAKFDLSAIKLISMTPAPKCSFTLLFLLFIHISSHCQEKKQVLKSWVRREVYLLPDNVRLNDTAYTKYSFQKHKVDLFFEPGWNYSQQEWQLTGDQLTIGPTTYTIESITDSTLIVFKSGFLRMVLDNENYLNQKPENLHLIGEFKSEPLYEANKYITPLCKITAFRNFLAQNLGGYHITRAVTFVMSFIVRKDGSIDNIQVVNGISEGFDAEVVRQLTKTGKDWTAAVYKGQPIQTQVTYTIKYLDSIVR
jgi:Gram-negative bacterial TonB protein C-terminal